MNAWARLRAMPRQEIAFRVRGLLRTHAQRGRVRARGTRWDRAALPRVLAASSLDAGMRRGISQRDWNAVDVRLRDRVRERGSRYVLDPARARALRQQVLERFPDADAAAAADAGGILADRYDLLGYRGLSFTTGDAPVDWHADPVHGRRAPLAFWADVPYLDPSCGDHKIIWELNRHQHFLRLGRAFWLTGDSRYADRIVAEVESWLDANPPLMGINWSSMLELALRSLSWVAAIHFLLAEPAGVRIGRDEPWLLDMCIALDRQLEHVAQNLSRYFSPNTHLTGEALALYTAGIALPELAGSTRWVSLGRSVLLREVDRQLCADGGHVERSTHYHRYTLDFYTLALLTAEHAGDRATASVFRAALGRLAQFMRAIADTNGQLPLVGDDDGGMLWPIAGRDPRDVRDSLAVAAILLRQPDLAPWGVPEEALWIAGPDAASESVERSVRPAPTSSVRARLFADSGFVTITTAGRDHLLFDTGPHGFRNGGHAHADALSIVLSIEGRPLLIDPGTATYTMDRALRDRMRSSQLHNTVTLDGRSSAVPNGPFHWRTRADAQLRHWRGNAGFACARGAHDGFAPARHDRTIIGGATGWLVIDAIDSDATHLAEGFWHFDPAWDLTQVEPGVVAAVAPDGARAWLVADAPEVMLIKGDRNTGLGWCSPRYGTLVPTWTARIAKRVAAGDVLVTWFGSGAQPGALERVSLDDDTVIGVRMRHGDTATVTLLRRDEDAPAREVEWAGYRTDARLLQWSRDGAGGLHVALADGTCAVPRQEGLPGIHAEAGIRDLSISLRRGRVDLCSTEPPPRLHVTGVAPGDLSSVTLNGREHRDMGFDSGITLEDWRNPGPADGPHGPRTGNGRPAADARSCVERMPVARAVVKV